MKIKIKKGRWTVGGTILDLFINSHREDKKIVRSKITKEHNYKFKTERIW